MTFSKRAFPKSRTPPVLKRQKARPRPTSNIVKLMKKVAAAEVHRNMEDKQQSLDYALSPFNNIATGSPDQLRVFPYINLGTNSADRNGDTINLRSLKLLGHVTVTPAYVTADVPRQRIMVRMVVLQPKRFGTYTACAATPDWMFQVLRNGNSVQSLDGSIASMYYPWNYEAFHIFAEKRIILKSDAFIASATLNGQYATEMFNLPLKFKNKKIKYTDTSSEPIGFCPMLLVSYAFLDGSAASTLSNAISLSFNVLAKYEDS